MADYTPVYADPDSNYTLTASAAVVGGQVLVISGVSSVAPAAGASGVVAGVAAHDAPAGARITVWQIPGVIHETTSPAGAAAGASVASSTAGGVDSGTVGTLAAAGTLLGTALSTAAAGAKLRWLGK